MHIDWRSLQRLSEGNAKFELDLLKIFVQDCCEHLTLLDRAIAQRQFDEIEQIAHHLKGASANVGAFVMRDAAHELERQSRRRSLNEPELLTTTIRESLSYIQAFIQTSA
jgi:HPt (histidine-containing phosphotransfer) domain-containing protein